MVACGEQTHFSALASPAKKIGFYASKTPAFSRLRSPDVFKNQNWTIKITTELWKITTELRAFWAIVRNPYKASCKHEGEH